MKKNGLLSDDIWVFQTFEAGTGTLASAFDPPHDTMFRDKGEPFPLADAAGSSLGLVVSSAKPVASIATLADYLVNGFWQYSSTPAHHWVSNTISYNISGLNSAEQFLAQSAMQAWSQVANISFVQTSGAANITFNHNGTMQAYTSGSWYGNGAIAYQTVDISADWIVSDGGANDGKTGIDSYGYQTYIHEIGHALGLGHQGPYNGSAVYSTDAVYANDTWQYSIMSYFAEPNFSGSSYRYVVTPQMADIYAVVSIYGAATSTRTGDTVYGFNSNAGAVFNFAGYASAPALTIHDSGGNDTLDASGYSSAQTIDLHPGAFSSVGGLVNNIGIALSTVIEKAIGGSGNDRLIASNTNSTLMGGDGNDVFIGGAGNDTIIGGPGSDNAVYSGNKANYRITFNAASQAFTISDQRSGTPDGSDTLSGVESFQFADGTIAIGAPVLNASNLAETVGWVPTELSGFLTYSDLTGLPPVMWRIQDVSTDGTNALLLNGSSLSAALPINLTPAQFAQVKVAVVTSSHEIWAVVSDGASWSLPIHFVVSPPAPVVALGPPVLTSLSVHETVGWSPTAISTYLTYSDPANLDAVTWRIQDVSSDGTSALLLNGSPLSASVPANLTSAQFSHLMIGSVSSAHEIWAVASDGTLWSSPVHFTISPPALPTALGPPVLMALDLQETGGGSPVNLSAHLTYSDPANIPAVIWRVQDVSSDGTNALSLNGSPLSASLPVNLTANQFAQVAITSVSSTHEIWAVANDGTYWSAPVHFGVSPPAAAHLAQNFVFAADVTNREAPTDSSTSISALIDYHVPTTRERELGIDTSNDTSGAAFHFEALEVSLHHAKDFHIL